MKTPKILIPIDWTDSSANGLRYAQSLAKNSAFELDLFHVVSNGSDEMPHSEIFHKEFEGRFKEILRKGNVSSEILLISEELEPEMIIMFPDVFNKEKKFFEESETGKIIKHSHYPVLLIPPDVAFKAINRIILFADINENILQYLRAMLKIFVRLKPRIDIVLFTDKTKDWNLEHEANTLLGKLKVFLNYSDISIYLLDPIIKTSNTILYTEKLNPDIICFEYDLDLFHKIFFQTTTDKLSVLKHKPILILPAYWQNSIKTG